MCDWVYKDGQTCGYDAFSLALPGVLMRMRRVHLFLAQVGHRIGAIVDIITEADMYLDMCDESLSSRCGVSILVEALVGSDGPHGGAYAYSK